jgi:hypothetical protein
VLLRKLGFIAGTRSGTSGRASVGDYTG